MIGAEDPDRFSPNREIHSICHFRSSKPRTTGNGFQRRTREKARKDGFTEAELKAAKSGWLWGFW